MASSGSSSSNSSDSSMRSSSREWDWDDEGVGVVLPEGVMVLPVRVVYLVGGLTRRRREGVKWRS